MKRILLAAGVVMMLVATSGCIEQIYSDMASGAGPATGAVMVRALLMVSLAMVVVLGVELWLY